jgi:chromosome segregation ATPase
VKAVKNEQSSQVSKLNDEIRLLKEKLMNQSAGAGAQDGQDASALDEKNRQRLRDLEEAMRSTWEAKSKLSEEYERDRQALLIEQQNAARQFEAARQRNWALLEQKEDLEITLGHVRTLLVDRLAHTPVAGLVGQWAEGLREVAQLERRLAEQDTVVQMYRSSLEKDSQALVQVTACTVRFAGYVLCVTSHACISSATQSRAEESGRAGDLRQYSGQHAPAAAREGVCNV